MPIYHYTKIRSTMLRMLSGFELYPRWVPLFLSGMAFSIYLYKVVRFAKSHGERNFR